ncbi:MAG: hybrid sensor histidine kinase/response regulator, partial [bacterium]
MADGPVRVILLEDQDDDALLIERELKRGGIAFTARRAVDRPSFIAALQELQMDLILSDNRL